VVERGLDGRAKVHELELYTCEAEGDFAAVLASIAARSQPPHTRLPLSLSLSMSLSHSLSDALLCLWIGRAMASS
jgi:hypothetical protein